MTVTITKFQEHFGCVQGWCACIDETDWRDAGSRKDDPIRWVLWGHSIAGEVVELYRNNCGPDQASMSPDLPGLNWATTTDELTAKSTRSLSLTSTMPSLVATFHRSGTASFDDQLRRRGCCRSISRDGGWRTGASRSKLTGTIQNDIIKEYLSRGTYARFLPPEPSLRRADQGYDCVLVSRGAEVEPDQRVLLPSAGSRRDRRCRSCLRARDRVLPCSTR